MFFFQNRKILNISEKTGLVYKKSPAFGGSYFEQLSDFSTDRAGYPQITGSYPQFLIITPIKDNPYMGLQSLADSQVFQHFVDGIQEMVQSFQSLA